MKTTQRNLIDAAKHLLELTNKPRVTYESFIDHATNRLSFAIEAAEADDSVDLTNDEIDRGLGVAFLSCPHYPGETEKEWEERVIKEQADAFRKNHDR